MPPLSAEYRGRRRKVWVVEGAYCSDTNVDNKFCQKSQQHKDLLEKLERYGYEIIYNILAFGVGGTLYDKTQEEMRKLGIPQQKMERLNNKLHIHALTTLQQAITCRRRLEYSQPTHQCSKPRHFQHHSSHHKNTGQMFK